MEADTAPKEIKKTQSHNKVQVKKAGLFLCTVFLIIGLTQTAGATYISESEANNSFAAAQGLDAAFSLDSDADIFWSTTYWHASVNAANGATTDVDYYAFTVGAASITGFFDIDYGWGGGSDVDITMALFDSNHNVLAVSDDSDLDPGSANGLDSFIGVYTFSNPGTYYLAVSNYANFPLSYGTYVGYGTGPEGQYGGGFYAGNSGPTSMNTSSGYYSGGDYVLHASLSSTEPIPEPATMLLLGSGLVGLAGMRRKWTAKRGGK